MTGVQTCALPIYPVEFRPGDLAAVLAAFAAVALVLSHFTVRSMVKKHAIR